MAPFFTHGVCHTSNSSIIVIVVIIVTSSFLTINIIIIITTRVLHFQVTHDVTITGVIKHVTVRRNATRARRLASEYSSQTHLHIVNIHMRGPCKLA